MQSYCCFVVGNITFKQWLARKPGSNVLSTNSDTQSTQIYMYPLQPKRIKLKKIYSSIVVIYENGNCAFFLLLIGWRSITYDLAPGNTRKFI